MEIPEIGIQSVGIDRIDVPNIHYYVPHTQTVPFILQIGSPVVDMPGCVKYHPDSAKNRETPNLKEDDSTGTKVLCDGEYPTYDAMDYTPEQILITQEVPPPPVQPPPTPPEFKPDAIPKTENKEVLCPGPAQLRVGDVTQSGDERVVGHQLSADGKTCETLYEPTTPVEKYLPSINQTTTTVAIAVVATAGAAATPLLLRVFKPVITKLWKTFQKKLGKKVDPLTRAEIQTNKYREKKGLPPLKKK